MDERVEVWRRDDGWTREIFVEDGKVTRLGSMRSPDPLPYDDFEKSLLGAGYTPVTRLHVSKTLNQLKEGLNLAEQSLHRVAHPNQHTEQALRVIEELQREVELLRPTGPDGSHGNLHTLECQCGR